MKWKLISALLFCSCMSVAVAQSQTKCFDSTNSVDVTSEVNHVEAWVDSDFQRVSELQLLLAKISNYRGKIDGIFGPETRKSLCGIMKGYIAIGGGGPDWGVNAPKDAPRFVRWLYTAVSANETGGEFPD